MADSKIEWTDTTWNPTTGCTKVSPGCARCYAERMHERLRAMGQPKYGEPFNIVKTHVSSLSQPLHWQKPRRIFVNSMSDLFHREVPLSFICRVFEVMRAANWHKYQILTKRSVTLSILDDILPWEPHIWMGVSIENADYAHRIDYLRATGAHVKFLSLEPLLGPLPNLNLDGIDWVIVGGESGPGARPMDLDWVRSLIRQCNDAGVPMFIKQICERGKKIPFELWPEELRVRGFPEDHIWTSAVRCPAEPEGASFQTSKGERR